MRLLLDTHAFLWFYSGDDRLSSAGKVLIDDPANECFLSIASVWEMGIKTSIGKLELRVDFAGLTEFMAANRIELLPISFAHIQRLQYLPFHHRDPFDRLLIAQALTEDLTLLSRDAVFPQYEVLVKWE
jgi:PIN domain nuclease of toxin-antitoxin system